MVLASLSCDARPGAGAEGRDRELALWPLVGLNVFERRGETVYQPATELEWQPATAGEAMTWPEAIAHCEVLTFAGGGWRLPTRIELMTLVDYERRAPASSFPGMTSESFWASTRDANFIAGVGEAVSYLNGDAPDFRVTGTRHRAHCVR